MDVPAKHSTRERAAFRVEFASALSAIQTLQLNKAGDPSLDRAVSTILARVPTSSKALHPNAGSRLPALSLVLNSHTLDKHTGSLLPGMSSAHLSFLPTASALQLGFYQVRHPCRGCVVCASACGRATTMHELSVSPSPRYA